MCHRNMKIISMSSVMVMNITILNIQVVNPISHGGGGLKTAPPCKTLK